LKKWLKRLGLILALPAVLALGLGLWLGFRYVTYSQEANEIHLAKKETYLKSVEELQSVGELGAGKARPNIVFILYDDLGYGDLGFTGNQAIDTPAIDRLAEQGVVLTNFYSPSAACTPSRAGFLTGRYPPRAGLPDVIYPSGSFNSTALKIRGTNHRLPAEEITISEVLKASGYRTGMVGKWHLGDRAPSLPNNFGFDAFFGALYSNDMKPFALYRNDKIVEAAPYDQRNLDARYTSEAVDFIENNANGENPFFLYFAHNFPHIPLFVAPERTGASDGGTYGDVVEAMDAGVEQIVGALEQQGILDDTIIIISSDNGPWYQGSAGPFRGRKGQTWEGGMHVPFLIHWPSNIEGGRTVDGMSMGIDLLPTLVDWLDLPLPEDRIIDGKSIRSMLEASDPSPHDYLYNFAGENIKTVRSDRYKYHGVRFHAAQLHEGNRATTRRKSPWLIDLSVDNNESYDVSSKYPEVAELMQGKLVEKREEFRTNKRGWIVSE